MTFYMFYQLLKNPTLSSKLSFFIDVETDTVNKMSIKLNCDRSIAPISLVFKKLYKFTHAEYFIYG